MDLRYRAILDCVLSENQVLPVSNDLVHHKYELVEKTPIGSLWLEGRIPGGQYKLEILFDSPARLTLIFRTAANEVACQKTLADSALFEVMALYRDRAQKHDAARKSVMTADLPVLEPYALAEEERTRALEAGTALLKGLLLPEVRFMADTPVRHLFAVCALACPLPANKPG